MQLKVFFSALLQFTFLSFYPPLFSARKLLTGKLSGWNTGLIVVGVILFVGGVVVAVVLAVLLFLRMKVSCMLI